MEAEALVRLDAGGYAFLAVLVGRPPRQARIFLEQKLYRFGYLFVGPEFEDVLPPVIVPADPADGRPEPQTVRGFTSDAALLDLYGRFRALETSGELRDGMVLEG